jgi:hypothetical protein
MRVPSGIASAVVATSAIVIRFVFGIPKLQNMTPPVNTFYDGFSRSIAPHIGSVLIPAGRCHRIAISYRLCR